MPFDIEKETGASPAWFAAHKGKYKIIHLLINLGHCDGDAVPTEGPFIKRTVLFEILIQAYKAEMANDESLAHKWWLYAEKLIKAGKAKNFDIYEPEEWVTPLWLAVMRRQPGLVKLMIQNGASDGDAAPKQKSEDWTTVLTEILRNAMLAESRKKEKEAKAWWDCGEKLLRKGKTKGFDIPNSYGETALFIASTWGHLPLCEYMVANGATHGDASRPKDPSWTVLSEMLLEAGMNAKQNNLSTAKRWWSLAKQLIEKGNTKTFDLAGKRGYTSLWFASSWGQLELCDLMITNGAIEGDAAPTIEGFDKDSSVLNRILGQVGDLQNSEAQKRTAEDMKGAAEDKKRAEDWTALAKKLVEKGKTNAFDKLDSEGVTPFWRACTWGLLPLCELMMAKGVSNGDASPTIQGYKNRTVLYEILNQAALFWSKDIKQSKVWTSFALSLLYQGKAKKVDLTFRRSKNALWDLAKIIQNVELLRLLLNLGISVPITDLSTLTSSYKLELSASEESLYFNQVRTNTWRLLLCIEELFSLAKEGLKAEVEEKSIQRLEEILKTLKDGLNGKRSGKTALQIALENKHFVIVEALLARGAAFEPAIAGVLEEQPHLKTFVEIASTVSKIGSLEIKEAKDLQTAIQTAWKKVQEINFDGNHLALFMTGTYYFGEALEKLPQEVASQLDPFFMMQIFRTVKPGSRFYRQAFQHASDWSSLNRLRDPKEKDSGSLDEEDKKLKSNLEEVILRLRVEFDKRKEANLSRMAALTSLYLEEELPVSEVVAIGRKVTDPLGAVLEVTRRFKASRKENPNSEAEAKKAMEERKTTAEAERVDGEEDGKRRRTAK